MSYWETLNNSGDAITALATIGTLFVAALVYHEARTIRKTEWISNQNAAWNEMSKTVLEFGNDCKIGDILAGENVDGDLTYEEEHLLMIFLNVVNSEYNGFRAGAISPRWVIHSFGMTTGIVSGNKDWLIPFMCKYGYQASFIRLIALLPAAGDDFKLRHKFIRRELLASSWVGRVGGSRFRSWLRRDYAAELTGAPCD